MTAKKAFQEAVKRVVSHRAEEEALDAFLAYAATWIGEAKRSLEHDFVWGGTDDAAEGILVFDQGADKICVMAHDAKFHVCMRTGRTKLELIERVRSVSEVLRLIQKPELLFDYTATELQKRGKVPEVVETLRTAASDLTKARGGAKLAT